MYRNHYICPDCSAEWDSDDEAMPDDQCGDCGMRHITPTKSDEYLPAAADDIGDVTARIAAATPWKLISWDSGDRIDAIVGDDWTDDDRPICCLPADSPHDALLLAAPVMLDALRQTRKFPWVHNAGITNDIEALRRSCLAYSDWNNDVLRPILEVFGSKGGA